MTNVPTSSAGPAAAPTGRTDAASVRTAPAAAAPEVYRPERPVRLVTAASLFDGHDAAINVMRRILQASGAEVIHLGHDRSVAEIVECAIQEDAQGIAVTSYQGGHVEFFEYMVDLLRERGADILVFGGGGGTILPSEIERLHAHGVARIYSPDDGRELGLQGMINDLLRRCDRPTVTPEVVRAEEPGLLARRHASLARLITAAETLPEVAGDLRDLVERHRPQRVVPVLGITGTGGAGKSSLVDELVRRFLADLDTESLAVISVDPSKRRTGGALLGDRIRMNAIHAASQTDGDGDGDGTGDGRVYMRSLATRQANLALSAHVQTAIDLAKVAGHDLVIVETSGIGQSDTEIVEHCDVSLYVMTADYGAATQLEKIDMIDFADCVAINKFDKPGSLDALRDVRKQFQRARQAFDVPVEDLPVFGTIASQFNDAGMNRLYNALIGLLAAQADGALDGHEPLPEGGGQTPGVIPADRTRYLAEIADASKRRSQFVERQTALARRWGQVRGAGEELRERGAPEASALDAVAEDLGAQLDPECRGLLESWPAVRAQFTADRYRFEVRGRAIEQDNYTETLAGTRVPKVALPRCEDPGDLLRWLLTENVPGAFPYASGVFPLKRVGEDPARMFAGEGGPERTNRRFHYVSRGMPAARLSTAFDSVTLYGQDPDRRPDIYGKVGNAGVSIATVDDAKRLYSGFDLADPKTSVSMTINGPAPMILAFFMNAAIDQACEKHLHASGGMEDAQRRIDALYAERGEPRPVYRGELPEGNDGLGLALLGVSGDEVLDAETYARIKAETLQVVRGTVQADILKEDQAQNTCIFSTEFALRMMGDIQAYFCREGVRNFYSVSISGYHIAEAGANPITQLAFTLANGFTYVEYYLSRGLAVDDFAPNLSFFFSNGVDAEYAVIGRVARRIWAKALRFVYGAGDRSQKLKYHIQTSGRSLHAQEIGFNDIRTTLQALYAIYDNCQSLHTNAYDEAITTPTEESVRRALAIQLIINKELGLAANENPLQGAFIVEELTDLVEEAVYAEFRRLTDRGGVLGAMERMYQRSKIQDESLYYEGKKHDGSLPIVGVNTFLDSKGSPTSVPREVIRSHPEEQQAAIAARDAFWARNADRAPAALAGLQDAALSGDNLFQHLLEVTKVASLGQISGALYEVGGKYRRNM